MYEESKTPVARVLTNWSEVAKWVSKWALNPSLK